MFFDLEKKSVEILSQPKDNRRITFRYQGKYYYYKKIEEAEKVYNEIVAEKIASRLNIPCCHYFLGCYKDTIGVISEMFSNEDFETMGTFLERVYGRQKIDEKNNIEDISLAFQKTFSTEVAEKLIEDLNRIFIFDALIGNCDRNEKNYGLIIRENKAIFAPLYDNDSMLSEFGIYDGDYSLEVKRSDYQNQKTHSINLLYEYLDQGEKQQKLFLSMLPVIEEESLHIIFEEMEKEMEVHSVVKEELLNRFKVNLHMIKKYWN